MKVAWDETQRRWRDFDTGEAYPRLLLWAESVSVEPGDRFGCLTSGNLGFLVGRRMDSITSLTDGSLLVFSGTEFLFNDGNGALKPLEQLPAIVLLLPNRVAVVLK